MADSNGIYKMQLDNIQNDVKEIKDDLSHSIDRLTDAVHGLTAKFDNWVHVAENSIPIKAVSWMFLILVLTIGGIEGIKVLSKIYIP